MGDHNGCVGELSASASLMKLCAFDSIIALCSSSKPVCVERPRHCCRVICRGVVGLGGTEARSFRFRVPARGVATGSSLSELKSLVRACLHGPIRVLRSFIAAGDSLPLVSVCDVSSSVSHSKSLSKAIELAWGVEVGAVESEMYFTVGAGLMSVRCCCM